MRGRFAAVVLSCSLMRAAAAFEPFQVQDIQVEGLQRVPVGTVFNYLPVQVGQTLDEEQAAEAIRQLYETGFFQDVQLERRDDVLLVEVVERPSIANIEIRGNEALDSELLRKALADQGFTEGRVFNRFLLSDIERELRNQYVALGQYDVELETTVSPLPRNRVGIRIDITESEPARIREVNIVGNQAYPESELEDLFQLGPKAWYNFFSDRDKYSREQLAADLERLRSFYQNRGFLNFAITSTQVALSPDREGVYLTVNVSEGERYEVGDVRLAGDLVVGEEEVRPLLATEPGETYSREDIVQSVSAISDLLGARGYAFANVNVVPEVDEDDNTVQLTYYVDPGRRVYVRQVNIRGNLRTRDEVIRRELRQLEGGWLSTEALKRSRARLDRLGFFESVNIETPRVPGAADQVDVEVNVTERLSGTLQAGIGYGQGQGVLLNFSVAQDNFLGTGDRVYVALNNSDVNTVYTLSYLDRFYTESGISRSFTLSHKETEAREADLADYAFSTTTVGVGYGIPLTEEDTLQVGLAYENLEIDLGADPAQRLIDFVDRNGDSYDNFKGTLGWVGDTRDSAVFPTLGSRQQITGEFTLPGSDLEYYKLVYTHARYFPLTDNLTLSLDGAIGYGDGYGETEDLPFFENFYAGGVTTVRGFRTNALGPRDLEEDDPLGGNARILGSAALVFPVPFTDLDSMRLAAFLDAGNVFDTEDGIEFSELRTSAGLGFIWLSPLGPLTLSFAEPLNEKENDEVQRFQFSLGTFF